MRCRACTCPATTLAHSIHEAACPYHYDARLWRSDRAWVVAGLGALAGEATQAIERMGHGVVAYVVDDGYATQRPAWWGDRPGEPTVVGLESFLRAEAGEPSRARLALGIGDPGARARFSGALDAAFAFKGIVRDPAAVVMPGATADEGAVFSAGVVASHGVHVGAHAFVNYNVTLGHDVKLGACSVVCPGAQLMGHVEVGARVFVGTGAIVIPKVKIGDGAVVGAGAVVIRDVPAGATVVGNPARVLEKVSAPDAVQSVVETAATAHDGQPMTLVDRNHGMTGGDLYVCEFCRMKGETSRAVMRPGARRPWCDGTRQYIPEA